MGKDDVKQRWSNVVGYKKRIPYSLKRVKRGMKKECQLLNLAAAEGYLRSNGGKCGA